jgi:hypothetical protein
MVQLSETSVRSIHVNASADSSDTTCVPCTAFILAELPKYTGRTSKRLATAPFFKYKLFATYAYGYGFTPFLIHDSQIEGGNLLWTTVFLTLNEMYSHYGFMPRELWLQLDNTGKENKNETMRAICSWLCATFKFERVTVFFLIKGHTHVIIDQIFGVITTHIKHMEILVPSVLQEQIDAVLAKVKNQSYQAKPTRFQHCLFDFKKLVADLGGSIPLHGLCNRKGYSDGLGDFKGLHEFVFRPSASVDGNGAVSHHRTSSIADWWPEEAGEGVAVLKKAPSAAPKVDLSPMHPIKHWEFHNATSVRLTINDVLFSCATHDRRERLKAEWEAVLDAIPDRIEDLRPDLRLVFKDLPSKAFVPDPTDADPENRRPAWHHQFVDRAQNPEVELANVSNVEYQRKLEEYWQKLRGCRQPTTDISNLFLVSTEHVLAKKDGVVSLYRIKTVQGHATAVDAVVVGTLFDHTPKPTFSGFFGTFQEHRTPVAGMAFGHAVNHMLSRENLLVGGVSLKKIQKPGGGGKDVFLTLETLRALALVSSDYELPERLPETHFDSDDEDEEAHGQARKQKATSKSRPKPPAKKKPAKRSGADSEWNENGSSSEEEDEDENEHDDDDDEEEEDDEDDDEDVDHEEGEVEDVEDGADEMSEPDEDENIDESVPFSVTAPCLVWMLVDGEEAEFKGHRHPVALAYLSNTASGFGTVAWYQNQWKPDKNGKPKNGPFVYKRFFTNATSTPSKRNGKRPVPVTKLTWDVTRYPLETPPFIPFRPDTSMAKGVSIKASMAKAPEDPTKWTYETVSFSTEHMATWAEYMEEHGYVMD